MNVIPICHCFDDRYVLPAAVSFYSMLKNASPKHRYALYVLHTDISAENQQKLKDLVAAFPNASLEFMNMNGRFADLFERTASKSHYSKEMFYKFLPPSLFPQYSKMLVTDVDVVWEGDISELFFTDMKGAVLAGSRGMVKKGSWVEKYVSESYQHFTAQDRAKLLVGAGLLLYDLDKMRAGNLTQKMAEYAFARAGELRQPEQDILNLVCWPHIKLFPSNAMVCSYVYDYYPSEQEAAQDAHYSQAEILNALSRPVQLHYATPVKPWNEPSCTKADRWVYYLAQTPFLSPWLTELRGGGSCRPCGKKVFSVSVFGRIFTLVKTKKK